MDLREILTGLDKEENKIQLYNNCKQPIFLFVWGITNSYHASEDITEEVFMRIFKYHNTYNEFKNPRTWIFTIAKNTTYDYMKKNKEYVLDETKMEYVLNKCNKVKTDDSSIVKEYLSTLNEIDRQIVNLRVFGGLTFVEISKIN